MFLLGISGYYKPSIIWSMLLIFLLISFPILKKSFFKDIIKFTLKSFKVFINSRKNNYIVFIISFSIIIVSLLNFISALAPPTEADTLSYHLAIPKYFINYKKIIFQPFYMSWGIPLHFEMFSTLGLLISNETLPKIITWFMSIVSAITLYLLTSEIFSKKAGLFAAGFYYLSPITIYLTNSAKNDLSFYAFIFLSIYFAILWLRKKGDKVLWISAVFTGLALTSKYQGIHWAISFGALIIILHLQNFKNLKIRFFKTLFIYCLISLIIASPWYLRNFIVTGDPFWPFGFSVFKSEYWTQALQDKYSGWQQGPGNSLYHYFIGLWSLTLNQSSWVGGLRIPYLPIQLTLIPGLFFYWQKLNYDQKTFIKYLLIPIVIYYTLWFTGYQQNRYVFPIMSLLLIPSSYIFWQIIKLRISNFFGTAFIVFVLLFSISYSFIFSKKTFKVVAGIETRNEYLEKNVNYFKDIQWINNNVKGNPKILFCDLKPFYLEHDFIMFQPNIFSEKIRKMHDNEFHDFLNQQKITHIFLPFKLFNSPEFINFKNLIDFNVKNKNISEIYYNNESKQILSRALGNYDYSPLAIYIVN